MASFPRKPVHQSARFFIGQVRSLAPAFANDGPSFDCEFARHLSKVVLTTPSLTVGLLPRSRFALIAEGTSALPAKLSSLEFRFALFEKSFHPFVLVFAGEAKREQINFAAQALI